MKHITNFLLLLVSSLFFSTGMTSAAEPNLPIIGVTEIKAPVDDSYWRTRVNTKSENFQTMLETQLTMVGRFRIIERNRIDEILSEQGLNNAVGDGMTASGGYNVGGVASVGCHDRQWQRGVVYRWGRGRVGKLDPMS